MGRPLSSSMITAIQAGTLRVALLVDMMFPGAPLFLWSGPYALSANGNSYTGAGSLGSVGKIEERNDETVPGVNLTLSGVPSSMLALALNQTYQGYPVNLWFACFDAQWGLINSPYQIFSGTMDVMEIKDGTDTGAITLSCENRMIETQRSRVRRYTAADQAIDYPSDTAFRYVAAIQLLQVYWGNPSGPSANLAGASGVTLNKTAT